MTADGGKFWTTRTVFRVEGDTLTIKEGAIERPRPTDLEPDDFGLVPIGEKPKEWAPMHVYKRRAK